MKIKLSITNDEGTEIRVVENVILDETVSYYAHDPLWTAVMNKLLGKIDRHTRGFLP